MNNLLRVSFVSIGVLSLCVACSRGYSGFYDGPSYSHYHEPILDSSGRKIVKKGIEREIVKKGIEKKIVENKVKEEIRENMKNEMIRRAANS